MRRRRNILWIFRFNLLFDFGLVRNTRPAVFNFRLRNFRFHSWRPGGSRRFHEPRGSGHHESVALHFRQRSRPGRCRQINSRLALNSKPLNGSRRICVHHVVIWPVIVDHIVLNGDVRHVHRIIDIGDILRGRKDPVAQNWFADESDVAKIVILRADIQLDVHASADRLS
jgi:hypothetical protein